MDTIGTRIASRRKELKMTQEDLAVKLGVSAQAVSKWENDASCPDISLLPQMVKVLDITTDELLTGKTSHVRVLPEEKRKAIIEVLKQDPRPSTQSGQKRPYGVSFAGYDVRFEVEEGVLTVFEVVRL